MQSLLTRYNNFDFSDPMLYGRELYDGISQANQFNKMGYSQPWARQNRDGTIQNNYSLAAWNKTNTMPQLQSPLVPLWSAQRYIPYRQQEYVPRFNLVGGAFDPRYATTLQGGMTTLYPRTPFTTGQNVYPAHSSGAADIAY